MLGLTQAQIADRAGFSAATVSIVEMEKSPQRSRARRVRLALIREELKRRKFRQENARIDRQRAVWNDIPDGPAKERLIEMLGGALWSMWNDHAAFEAGDALLFCLPEPAANKLLAEFFDPDDEPPQ